MAKLTITPEDLKRSLILDANWYPVKITEVVEEKNKKGDAMNIVIDMIVETSGNVEKDKFIHRAFLNGKPISGSPQKPTLLLANSFPVDGFAPVMPGKVLEFISRNHDIIIDELRVSSIMRVHYDSPFPVPTKPYVNDEYSLLLMHFDGVFDAVDVRGETFEADFSDKK